MASHSAGPCEIESGRCPSCPEGAIAASDFELPPTLFSTRLDRSDPGYMFRPAGANASSKFAASGHLRKAFNGQRRNRYAESRSH
jgi:hypothetical protein